MVFIYRDEVYYKTEDEWAREHADLEYPREMADIIVAKHRNGPIGAGKGALQDRPHQVRESLQRGAAAVMKSFSGFPANMQFTPVPNLFMNALMPGMDSPELKTMLYIFQTILPEEGNPALRQLERDCCPTLALTASLQQEGRAARKR